ncbi:MAG: GNAT family N-acetyltransferase [Pseudomonadota bacterium]
MTSRLHIQFHDRLADIDATQWDALAGPTAPPFTRHAFLTGLEASGSVSAEQGWEPLHLSATDDNGALVAALPLYLKHHSWGEFVFDWAWADAYQRAGLAYYPKLVSASPFTPATAERLMLADDCDAPAVAGAVLQAVENVASSNDLSSIHLQFLDASGAAHCRARDYVLRKDCQFHWCNQGYRDFDEFLATFSSAKRKKVRRERRRLTEAGIHFEHIAGPELTAADIDTAFHLTRQTFVIRGREPYLNRDFFVELVATLPNALHVVFANHGEKRIAAAIFYKSSNTLYGRYWGSDADYHSLHFETCYYQGIDLAIREGLDVFEPGTQGEHKISRGFLPVETWSAHWLSHPTFASAIGDHVERERAHIDSYMAAVNGHSPYRSDTGSD